MNHTRTNTSTFSSLCAVFLFCCEALGQEATPPPTAEKAAPEAVSEVSPESVPSQGSPEAAATVSPEIASVPEAVPAAVTPLPAIAAAPSPAPAADVAQASRDDDDDADDDEKSAKKKKKVEIGGRLHAGYTMTREAESPTDSGRETENAFDVRRASAQLTWRPEKWMKAVVQIDVAEAFELGSSILTDAFVHIMPIPELQIRFGQFKKPFSASILQSPAKLRVIERGPGVEYLAKDLLFGDRDLGLQLSGLLLESIQLGYQIGVFNGNGPNITEHGNSKDIVARIQLRPLKQLEIGANVSSKFISDPRDRQPSRAFAEGGDLRVGVKGFRFFAEALVAQDHTAYAINAAATADDPPISFVVLAMASYRHKFKTNRIRFAVEPAFKIELFDQDTEIADDHLWIFTPGINGYFGNYFKLMFNGAFTRSGRNARSNYTDAESIEVLACFDI
jgi:hypothetical protein